VILPHTGRQLWQFLIIDSRRSTCSKTSRGLDDEEVLKLACVGPEELTAQTFPACFGELAQGECLDLAASPPGR
jgi:hypothetical protein